MSHSAPYQESDASSWKEQAVQLYRAANRQYEEHPELKESPAAVQHEAEISLTASALTNSPLSKIYRPLPDDVQRAVAGRLKAAGFMTLSALQRGELLEHVSSFMDRDMGNWGRSQLETPEVRETVRQRFIDAEGKAEQRGAQPLSLPVSMFIAQKTSELAEFCVEVRKSSLERVPEADSLLGKLAEFFNLTVAKPVETSLLPSL